MNVESTSTPPLAPATLSQLLPPDPNYQLGFERPSDKPDQTKQPDLTKNIMHSLHLGLVVEGGMHNKKQKIKF